MLLPDSPPVRSLRELLAYAIAIIIASLLTGGGLATLFTLWVNRGSRRQEVTESAARTRLADAQTDESISRRQHTNQELFDELLASQMATAKVIGDLEAACRHKDDQIHALEQQAQEFKALRTLARLEDEKRSTGS